MITNILIGVAIIVLYMIYGEIRYISENIIDYAILVKENEKKAIQLKIDKGDE